MFKEEKMSYCCFEAQHVSPTLWAWRRPLVKRMCPIMKTQLGVTGIAADDPWMSQPWPTVFTFPNRGSEWLGRFPLSKAGQLIQQGGASMPRFWDDLIFQVWDCPKCLLLEQRQILLTDRSTVQSPKCITEGLTATNRKYSPHGLIAPELFLVMISRYMRCNWYYIGAFLLHSK